MTKTRVGVIGLGGIAQLVHLPILSKLPSVQIEAVSEINKTRLSTISEKFNIDKTYTDYKEMLNDTELDAAIIATPTNTHHQVAIDCLNKGVNILIEKPIATSLEEAKNIDSTAKQVNKLAMVGMNARFRPDSMLLKSLINSGELGEIFYIRCGWNRKQSSDENWFLKKKEAGGGVILDLGIVLLDLGIWLLDYPPLQSISVSNFMHQSESVEDSAVGFLRFKNNAVLNFEVSWSLHSERDSFVLTAFGTEGTAHLNPLRAYKRMEGDHMDYTPSTTGNIKNLYKKSYENELKHFIASVRGEVKPRSSSEDALVRMELIEGIYKSAESKSEITY
jgi:predicted dehydrogenase